MNLNARSIIVKKNKLTWINNRNLIIFAFSTVFYGRIFCTITGAPSILAHAHFAIIPIVLGITLITTKTNDSKQIRLAFSFIIGLFILLFSTLLSAFWNEAGLINGIISFMMLGEPIMFLLAFTCIPMSVKSIVKVRKWLIWSVSINFLLAAVQKPLIDAGMLYAEGFNGTDGCGGVFFVSGAGNYVSASVSFAFAIYFLVNEKTFTLWSRIIAILASFWQILFSDSKQLVLAYLIAGLLLIVLNTKNWKKTLKLLMGVIIIGLIFLWCVNNVVAFKAYTAWARPELYQADGVAWYAKFYSIRVIMSQLQSPLDWLFGLGPGHTISRLGAWFLQDYKSILAPLGATTSTMGLEAREFVSSFWLTYSSSLFSPIFGWAGIWGDLGLFGLGAYLFLTYLVWHNFALDNSLKITLLSIFVLGFIFTQMEEPGYMVSISLILGLAWQKQRLKHQTKQRPYSEYL